MHCLDHRSVFHMKTYVLWAKSYLPPPPPSPHAMLFVRKGLPTSRPTLHRGGGGGGSERILQQFGKKALCPTHFGSAFDLSKKWRNWKAVDSRKFTKTPAEASRKPLITGFAEPLSKQVCDNVVKLATKNCFQSVNEIQKLRGHELEETHINNPPESDRKPFVLTVA